MIVRSFVGYLNADLFGGEFPVVNNTFTVNPAVQLQIIMTDGAGDSVVEGDSDGGSVTTEDSEDPQGDQEVFARDAGGNIIFDGDTFYLESAFVFEIGGQQFTGYHFEQDGGGTVDFTILPPDLPAGTATILSVNFTPAPDAVPYDLLTSGDEEIDESIYSNLDLSGDDTIIAGSGEDTILGGDGDDVIYGDVAPVGTNLSFIPDPSGNGTTIDDGDDIGGGVTLTAGGVQVEYVFVDPATGASTADFEFNNSDDQFTAGLNGGVDPGDNAIFLEGSGGISETSTTTINFSAADPTVEGEVRNVNFRINDIDVGSWQDIVTITAFDADNNPVEITLTGGANMVLSDTDGVAGNDTAIAIPGTGNQNPADPNSSLLVEIAGPVQTIIIDYGNLGTGGQRIDLTEVFFEPIPVENPDGFDDTIDGGAGEDIIFGNQGDDTVIISSGTDTIDGGSGDDTFDAFGGGSSLSDETITVTVDDDGDGTIAKTNDGTTDTVTSIETFIADEAVEEADRITITTDDLTAADITGLDDNATGTYTSTNGLFTVSFGGPGEPTLSEVLSGTAIGPGGVGLSGTGTFAITGGDEAGQVGNIAFENFENIDFTIICFAEGTLINTTEGPVAVETLKAGDLVVTQDHGLQPLRWTGGTHLDAATLARKPHLRPIRIKAGALAPDMPARDLVVSPQHRILLRSGIAIRMFDASELFLPAKHLLGLPGVAVAHDLAAVTYVHIMCEDHEIVEAEGALTETLYTGTEALKALGADARREIDDVFGDAPYLNRPLARAMPKGRRARRFIERHVKNEKQVFQRQL